ncbi:MAG: hypothetical protein ACJA1G_001234 [Qipengyuania sp.]|jgi:hypothetical protein
MWPVVIPLHSPAPFPCPGFLPSEPQVIEGPCTRRGQGRGYYSVVDGDTHKLGDSSVVGIDTAEKDADCPAEAVQAEASTRALQGWLNRETENRALFDELGGLYPFTRVRLATNRDTSFVGSLLSEKVH